MSPIPSFSGLNTALRGVTAQQRALDVTGHNIANADTPGFSRQEAVLGAAPSLNVAGATHNGHGAQLGQGVDVLQYRRLRDDFLDLQWRGQSMTAAESETEAKRLAQIESLLNDADKHGLGDLLNAFYSSWNDLATNPESPAARTAVIKAAQNLVSGFKSTSTSIAEVGGQAKQAINDLLGPSGPIAPIAEEINVLNLEINRALLAGQQPNDLLDRRDQLLDQLSRYSQVSTSVPDQAHPGWLKVSFAGAHIPLVDSASQPAVNVPTSATLPPKPGGILQGLKNATEKIAGPGLPNYLASLDALAEHIVQTVDIAHPAPPIFFGSTADTISVAISSASEIKAGSTGAVGESDIARTIADGRNASTTALSTLVTMLGADIANASASATAGTRVLNSLTAQRASTHGVSVNEEMTNMLRFQRGYQAAARALTTMDENLDVLINRTGRVGL